MVFEWIDTKPRNPYLSLAIDEALSIYFGKQKENFLGGLRLWANPQTIVLGRTCVPQDNVIEEVLKNFQSTHKKSIWSHSPPIVRRASGGGTVVHGPGNINYSLFISLEKFPLLYSVKDSYKTILELINQCLVPQGMPCEIRGQSDLVLKETGRKISGNAQFRKNGVLVHHGTLIARQELISEISSMLKHPPKEPDYREGREHDAFLGSLPVGFDVSAFYYSLSRNLSKLLGVPELAPLELPERQRLYQISRQLVKSIYSKPAWILNKEYQDVKEILTAN